MQPWGAAPLPSSAPAGGPPHTPQTGLSSSPESASSLPFKSCCSASSREALQTSPLEPSAYPGADGRTASSWGPKSFAVLRAGPCTCPSRAPGPMLSGDHYGESSRWQCRHVPVRDREGAGAEPRRPYSALGATGCWILPLKPGRSSRPTQVQRLRAGCRCGGFLVLSAKRMPPAAGLQPLHLLKDHTHHPGLGTWFSSLCLQGTSHRTQHPPCSPFRMLKRHLSHSLTGPWPLLGGMQCGCGHQNLPTGDTEGAERPSALRATGHLRPG